MMRKFLAFAFVVAVVGAAGSAKAVDRSGQFALGVQEVFTSGGAAGSAAFGSSAGSWSLKYGVTSDVTGQFTIGFDLINKAGGNRQINFGARLLYDLVENENSDFYTGLGIAYEVDDISTGGGDVLRFQVPLGWEFSFASHPEIGFSMEAGIIFDYAKDAGDQTRVSSVGGTVGGNLGLGVHYYF